MGFASMFEELIEKLGSEFPHIKLQDSQKENSHSISQSSLLKAKSYQKPPKKFVSRVTQILSENGCPSYLKEHYIKWIWQLKTGQKVIDQILDDFVELAMPLITSYLQKQDPTTIAFVQKHSLITSIN